MSGWTEMTDDKTTRILKITSEIKTVGLDLRRRSQGAFFAGYLSQTRVSGLILKTIETENFHLLRRGLCKDFIKPMQSHRHRQQNPPRSYENYLQSLTLQRNMKRSQKSNQITEPISMICFILLIALSSAWSWHCPSTIRVILIFFRSQTPRPSGRRQTQGLDPQTRHPDHSAEKWSNQAERAQTGRSWTDQPPATRTEFQTGVTNKSPHGTGSGRPADHRQWDPEETYQTDHWGQRINLDKVKATITNLPNVLKPSKDRTFCLWRFC